MRVGVVVIHAILEMQTISIAIDPLVCFRAAFDFQPPYTHHSNPVRFAKLDEKSKHLQPDQYGLFFSPLQCIPIASRTCCARSRCASCYPLLENIRNHAKVPYVATVTSRQRHLLPRQDNMAIEEPNGQSLITWHSILNNRRVRLISESLVHVCKWIHYTLHACMNDNVNLGTLTVFGIYTNGS